MAAGLLVASCGGGDDTGGTEARDGGGRATTTGAPPSTTASTATTGASAGSGGGVLTAEFVGELTEVTERGGRILKNRGEFEVTEEGVVGSVTFSAEGQVGIGGAELAEAGAIACVQVEVALAPGAVVPPEGPGTIEVTVQRTVDLLYRACPPALTADPTDELVELTFDGNGGFSGSFLYEGATNVEFVATAEG